MLILHSLDEQNPPKLLHHWGKQTSPKLQGTMLTPHSQDEQNPPKLQGTMLILHPLDAPNSPKLQSNVFILHPWTNKIHPQHHPHPSPLDEQN